MLNLESLKSLLKKDDKKLLNSAKKNKTRIKLSLQEQSSDDLFNTVISEEINRALTSSRPLSNPVYLSKLNGGVANTANNSRNHSSSLLFNQSSSIVELNHFREQQQYKLQNKKTLQIQKDNLNPIYLNNIRQYQLAQEDALLLENNFSAIRKILQFSEMEYRDHFNLYIHNDDRDFDVSSSTVFLALLPIAVDESYLSALHRHSSSDTHTRGGRRTRSNDQNNALQIHPEISDSNTEIIINNSNSSNEIYSNRNLNFELWLNGVLNYFRQYLLSGVLLEKRSITYVQPTFIQKIQNSTRQSFAASPKRLTPATAATAITNGNSKKRLVTPTRDVISNHSAVSQYEEYNANSNSSSSSGRNNRNSNGNTDEWSSPEPEHDTAEEMTTAETVTVTETAAAAAAAAARADGRRDPSKTPPLLSLPFSHSLRHSSSSTAEAADGVSNNLFLIQQSASTHSHSQHQVLQPLSSQNINTNNSSRNNNNDSNNNNNNNNNTDYDSMDEFFNTSLSGTSRSLSYNNLPVSHGSHSMASSQSYLPPVRQIVKLSKEKRKEIIMKQFYNNKDNGVGGGSSDSKRRKVLSGNSNSALFENASGGTSDLYGGSTTTTGGGMENISDTVRKLREELSHAKRGLAQLDYLVDENITWVHTNMEQTTKNQISTRSKERCKLIAIERLYVILGDYVHSTLKKTIIQWKKVNQINVIWNISKRYCKLKAIEKLTNVLTIVVNKQYRKGWEPWYSDTQAQIVTEKTKLSVLMTKIGRGHLARNRVKAMISTQKAVIIQCIIRKFLARVHKRKNQQLKVQNKNALTIQLKAKNFLEIKNAKKLLIKMRQDKEKEKLDSAAIQIQKIMRSKLQQKQYIEMKIQHEKELKLQLIEREKQKKLRQEKLKIIEKQRKEDEAKILKKLNDKRLQEEEKQKKEREQQAIEKAKQAKLAASARIKKSSNSSTNNTPVNASSLGTNTTTVAAVLGLKTVAQTTKSSNNIARPSSAAATPAATPRTLTQKLTEQTITPRTFTQHEAINQEIKRKQQQTITSKNNIKSSKSLAQSLLKSHALSLPQSHSSTQAGETPRTETIKRKQLENKQKTDFHSYKSIRHSNATSTGKHLNGIASTCTDDEEDQGGEKDAPIQVNWKNSHSLNIIFRVVSENFLSRVYKKVVENQVSDVKKVSEYFLQHVYQSVVADQISDARKMSTKQQQSSSGTVIPFDMDSATKQTPAGREREPTTTPTTPTVHSTRSHEVTTTAAATNKNSKTKTTATATVKFVTAKAVKKTEKKEVLTAAAAPVNAAAAAVNTPTHVIDDSDDDDVDDDDCTHPVSLKHTTPHTINDSSSEDDDDDDEDRYFVPKKLSTDSATDDANQSTTSESKCKEESTDVDDTNNETTDRNEITDEDRFFLPMKAAAGAAAAVTAVAVNGCSASDADKDKVDATPIDDDENDNDNDDGSSSSSIDNVAKVKGEENSDDKNYVEENSIVKSDVIEISSDTVDEENSNDDTIENTTAVESGGGGSADDARTLETEVIMNSEQVDGGDDSDDDAVSDDQLTAIATTATTTAAVNDYDNTVSTHGGGSAAPAAEEEEESVVDSNTTAEPHTYTSTQTDFATATATADKDADNDNDNGDTKEVSNHDDAHSEAVVETVAAEVHVVPAVDSSDVDDHAASSTDTTADSDNDTTTTAATAADNDQEAGDGDGDGDNLGNIIIATAATVINISAAAAEVGDDESSTEHQRPSRGIDTDTTSDDKLTSITAATTHTNHTNTSHNNSIDKTASEHLLNHQKQEMYEKMLKLSELEKSILEKERYMSEMAEKTRKMEELMKQLETEKLQKEQQQQQQQQQQQHEQKAISLESKPVAVVNHNDNVMNSNNGGGGGGTSSMMNTRNSIYSSIPNHMKTLVDGQLFTPPADAVRMTYDNQEWCQLYDDTQLAHYWYNTVTMDVQWHTPGTQPYTFEEVADESGYESTGGITDYSTDNYESGGEENDEDSMYYGKGKGNGHQTATANANIWQEYWDEQAAAKYWFNSITGEATWTRPEELNNIPGNNSSPNLIPGSATEYSQEGGFKLVESSLEVDTNILDSNFINEDWISYLDDATGQEYWYNVVTGQTSWA